MKDSKPQIQESQKTQRNNDKDNLYISYPNCRKQKTNKKVEVYQGKKATLPLQKKKKKLQLTSHQNQWKQEENAVKSLEVFKEK